jgi:hypothetical protein
MESLLLSKLHLEWRLCDRNEVDENKNPLVAVCYQRLSVDDQRANASFRCPTSARPKKAGSNFHCTEDEECDVEPTLEIFDDVKEV